MELRAHSYTLTNATVVGCVCGIGRQRGEPPHVRVCVVSYATLPLDKRLLQNEARVIISIHFRKGKNEI